MLPPIYRSTAGGYELCFSQFILNDLCYSHIEHVVLLTACNSCPPDVTHVVCLNPFPPMTPFDVPGKQAF